MRLLIILCFFSITNGELNQSDQANTEWSCKDLDFCEDKTGFEAIRWLHRQLDDDANGNVDISESDEFIREELHVANGYEKQKAFHGNDKHITVDELWRSWKVSEVHNWTLEETLEWLKNSVKLPQYADLFTQNQIDGTTLPRFANSQFVSSLGIKDPIHRQKVSLKAMDVVLFGPQKHHNYVKDIILALSCVVAIGGCWFAYVQYKNSQMQLKKMLKDMDALQKAEDQLKDLNRQLDQAKHDQQLVTSEKATLEEKLKSNRSGDELHYLGFNNHIRDASITNVSELNRICELEEELRETREQLNRAMANKSWSPSHQLQLWLQLTHELELNQHNAKRQAAEMQLLAAKEGCDKLKKKRSTFLGSFRVAHGSSIDDVDNRILLARTALSEITKDLKERLHRWQQIEQCCGFSIVQNRGYLHIQNELLSDYSKSKISQLDGLSLTRTNSECTLHDNENCSYNYQTTQLGFKPLLASPSSSMNCNAPASVNLNTGSVISLLSSSGVRHRLHCSNNILASSHGAVTSEGDLNIIKDNEENHEIKALSHGENSSHDNALFHSYCDISSHTGSRGYRYDLEIKKSQNESTLNKHLSSISLSTKKRLEENGLEDNNSNQINSNFHLDDKASTSSGSDNLKISPKFKKKKTFNLFTKLRRKKSTLLLDEVTN